MKNIQLQVRLEDNELFEKSVIQALISQAKQIAREEMSKELKKEIERIANAKVNEVKNSSYYNSITTRITDLIVQRLEREIRVNTDDINKMIQEKVDYFLNQKLKDKEMEKFIQHYFDQAIVNLLTNRLIQSNSSHLFSLD